jgi:hypothetical protein
MEKLMANQTILDLYKTGEWSTYPRGKTLDKTPLSIDGGEDIIASEERMERARRGKLNEKRYSDIFTNK